LPQYQQQLKGIDLDQQMQHVGGAQKLVSSQEVQDTAAEELRALREAQARGEVLDWTAEQYGYFRRGLLDIAKCRTATSVSNQGGTDSDDDALKKKVLAFASQLANLASEYIAAASDKWKLLKPVIEGFKHIDDALDRTLDSLDMADTAAAGQVPTTLKSIERLASFAKKEDDIFTALAQKRSADWLDESGVNALDPTRNAAARSYLDTWAQKLDKQLQLIHGVLPVATSTQKLLADPRVVHLRLAVTQWTPVGLDADALQDVIYTLRSCASQIRKIQSRLSEARAVIY